MDEEKELYDGLHNRAWTEVSNQLLEQQPDGFVLLADAAFPAFLPAWLSASLEDNRGALQIREYLAYAFSHTMRQFRTLNSQQRETVRAFLVHFENWTSSEFVKKRVTEAITLIDDLAAKTRVSG